MIRTRDCFHQKLATTDSNDDWNERLDEELMCYYLFLDSTSSYLQRGSTGCINNEATEHVKGYKEQQQQLVTTYITLSYILFQLLIFIFADIM